MSTWFIRKWPLQFTRRKKKKYFQKTGARNLNGAWLEMGAEWALTSTSHHTEMLIHVGQGPWDFPGGPVVKAPCFHYGRHGFNPWWGNKDSTCCAVQPKKTSEKKKKLLEENIRESLMTLR